MHLEVFARSARPLGWVSRLGLACALYVCVSACAPSERTDGVAPIQRTEAADAARGLAYAQQACARCHAVTSGAPVSPQLGAPTFEAIANTPGMTGIALDAWLHTSHPTMPNLIIDPDRIDDLSAYISTLRRGSTDPNRSAASDAPTRT